jgi:hypothetical protein
MLQVTSLGIMHGLENREEGELCYVHNEKKMFKCVNGEWESVEAPKGELNMNVYDMNKSIVAQLPDISKKDLEAGKKKINQVASNGRYFMLLCNELKYYTVFNIIPEGEEKIEDVLLECIDCFGATIKSIDDTPEGALEIWIVKDKEAYAMYFFNYDGGVEICAI